MCVCDMGKLPLFFTDHTTFHLSSKPFKEVECSEEVSAGRLKFGRWYVDLRNHRNGVKMAPCYFLCSAKQNLAIS